MLRSNNFIIINDIKKVSKYFEELSQIDVGNTSEFNNVILSYQNIKKPKKEQPSEMDKEERKWLLKNIEPAIKKISEDRYTRQAIIYNMHNSGLDHNCLNLFHLYYSGNWLNMNVYVRSMNFDANFENDLYTFQLLLDKACHSLMLDKGNILVFIMSLHRLK